MFEAVKVICLQASIQVDIILYAGVVVKRNAAEGTLSFRLSAAELPTRGDYLSI